MKRQIQPHPGPHDAMPGGPFDVGILLRWTDGEEYGWDDVDNRYVREVSPGVEKFVYFYDDGSFLEVTVPGGPVQIGTWT